MPQRLRPSFPCPARWKADNGGDDLRAVLILLRAAIDKAVVDLDLVKRGGAQIAERRIASAEIIKRQPDTQFFQRFEGLVDWSRCRP